MAQNKRKTSLKAPAAKRPDAGNEGDKEAKKECCGPSSIRNKSGVLVLPFADEASFVFFLRKDFFFC